ncbi:hypothetical protein PTTG_02773 [Puccinia triticina 1-1 BBBD Race 1]|uniref:Uncharacterized protein n=1 Tax=Puccinia triticina (isolate 1-1 / race 1 (BBBD)) TaxID=630390 RepID=A0A0C4EPS0_PUCT1|nr:hypothetical protein PTTG_02773 [Puccinia triticina 1-1 BBBD Race 1]
MDRGLQPVLSTTAKKSLPIKWQGRMLSGWTALITPPKLGTSLDLRPSALNQTIKAYKRQQGFSVSNTAILNISSTAILHISINTIYPIRLTNPLILLLLTFFT